MLIFGAPCIRPSAPGSEAPRTVDLHAGSDGLHRLGNTPSLGDAEFAQARQHMGQGGAAQGLQRAGTRFVSRPRCLASLAWPPTRRTPASLEKERQSSGALDLGMRAEQEEQKDRADHRARAPGPSRRRMASAVIPRSAHGQVSRARPPGPWRSPARVPISTGGRPLVGNSTGGSEMGGESVGPESRAGCAAGRSLFAVGLAPER